MQASGEAHDTPDSRFWLVPGLPGTVWTVHRVPFQRSANGWLAGLKMLSLPR